jgi:Ca2+-binding RTX toxin-like protein
MPTLNLSFANGAVRLNDPGLVGFAAVDGAATATSWSYLTPAGHRVTVTGTGMTYDAAGRPISGTATQIALDLGADGKPDLFVAGLGVAATSLDDGPASFWQLLDGNDVIFGPDRVHDVPAQSAVIFGDGIVARPGSSTGGQDLIHAGNASGSATGDVENVGSPIVGSPAADYRGGNDEILGLVTDKHHGMTGDAWRVYGGSRLTGGNDTLFIQSTNATSSVDGDAGDVVGRAVGGNDYISAGKDFQGTLAGDVREAHPGSQVEGGDDKIDAGDMGEHIVGDVYKLRGGTLVGGDDTIDGGGGNDIIAGDAWEVRPDSTSTGGDDLIHAGGGNDEVYSDAGYGPTGALGVGGDDRVYGESGNDRLHGEGGADTIDGGTQSDRIHGGDGGDWLSGGADADTLYGDAGADILDGGSGADLLAGLTGDDTYFVNDPGDVVYELAGFGIDTVWTTLSSTTLAAHVEILRYNGVGDFAATGNELANTIAGSAGNDSLVGGAGDDTLIGGAGGDTMRGGDGIDTVSYATASAGVDARMLAMVLNQGDATGDGYDGIENLTGSDFGDTLIGGGGANLLEGRSGDDLLVGYLDDDTLVGGAGSDTLSGEAGDNVLRGGAQADLLQGYLGDDVFVFNATADSRGSGRDVIRGSGNVAAIEGAGAAGGDLVDLSGIDANAMQAGNQAFAFGGTGIGRVSLVDAGGSTLVRGNTDKDASFEFQLLIEDGGTLARAYKALDFIL